MLQIAVDSSSLAGGYHTTIKFDGNLSGCSSLIRLSVASNYEYMTQNEEWMPYDNIYVLNYDIYKKQAQKINASFDEVIQERFQKQFSETADPEILYALLNSSNGYSSEEELPGDEEKKLKMLNGSAISSEKRQKIRDWIQGLNLENCNDVENLRYISSLMQTLRDLNSIHEVMFDGIKEKCDTRLSQIAKTRQISLKDKVEEIIEELHSEKPYSSNDVMIDFINHDIQRAKRFDLFLTAESVKDNILHSKEIYQEKEKRRMNGNEIEQCAENIKSRQLKFNQVFEALGIKGNNDDVSEVAYNLSQMSKIVSDGKEEYKELSDEIVDKFVENSEFEKAIEEWKKQQKANLDRAIQEKVQELIKKSEKKRLSEQIFSISSQKIGFLDRLFGKQDYYKAIIQNLKIKKQKINEKGRTEKDIDDLLKYVKKRGMTEPIADFLEKYYNSPIRISPEQKKEIEEALSMENREKSEFLVPEYHFWEYKNRAKEISKMNMNLLIQDDQDSENPNLDANNNSNKLRAYVNQVMEFTKQQLNKNKDKDKDKDKKI